MLGLLAAAAMVAGIGRLHSIVRRAEAAVLFVQFHLLIKINKFAKADEAKDGQRLCAGCLRVQSCPVSTLRIPLPRYAFLLAVSNVRF